TSQLVTAGGSVVDISNASAEMQYVGFADGGSVSYVDPRDGINQTNTWQVPRLTQLGGYVQGANAGTVELYAPNVTMAGTLRGATTIGPNQVASPPLGGQLLIGSDNTGITNPQATGVLDLQAGFSRPDIVMADGAAALAQAVAASGNSEPVQIDT